MVARTSLSIRDTQKRAFDKMRAEHTIEHGRTVKVIEFFGLMIQYYQDHLQCMNNKTVGTLLSTDYKVKEDE